MLSGAPFTVPAPAGGRDSQPRGVWSDPAGFGLDSPPAPRHASLAMGESAGMPAPIWKCPRPSLVLVGGGPGAGKTRLARAVVRRLPDALLLDKDQLLGAWVDWVLRASGAAVDRDGALYWQEVRPLEYATLMAVAFDHLALGKSVVIDAPFGPELADAAWLARMCRECDAREAVLLAVWVSCDAAAAYCRLRARGEPRDRWKLEHWDEFLARQPYALPAGASLVVQNGDGDPTDAQVARVFEAIQRLARQPGECPP
jgi:predicted kinase